MNVKKATKTKQLPPDEVVGDTNRLDEKTVSALLLRSHLPPIDVISSPFIKQTTRSSFPHALRENLKAYI